MQYPAHYGASRTARYLQDIAAKKVAADCIGAAKGYAWTGGGSGVLESIGTGKTFANHYGANGCPDKSANLQNETYYYCGNYDEWRWYFSGD